MAKEILKNNNNLEILIDKRKVETKTINGGFDNEKTEFRFSGRVKKNVPTIIGTLELTPEDLHYLPKKPVLKRGINFGLTSVLKMRLKSVTKEDSGHVISYLFDLIYTGKESFKNRSLQYSFKNRKTKKSTTTKVASISRVEFGSTKMSDKGASRLISVHGDVGAVFKLAINKFDDARNSDKDIISSTESSILKKGVYNSTYNCNDGEVNIIEAMIGRDGKYSFLQEFPASTQDTRYSINISPTSIDRMFRRSIWTFKDGSSANDVVRGGWSGWYSNIINQKSDIKLILRATTTSSYYKINKQAVSMIDHDSDGGTAAIQIYDKYYYGKPGGVGKTNKRFTLTYNLETVESVRNIAKKVYTTQFNNSGSTSSWTNSNYLTNGGTFLEITNIVVDDDIDGDTGNDRVKISFDVRILKMGTSDVIMTLDLDNIINPT